MSVRELRRRLREVHEGSCHLHPRLPPDSVHNALLTIADIASYLGMRAGWLRIQRKNTPPNKCLGGCPSTDTCRAVPPCRRMDGSLQRKLSAFFTGWDNGDLVKARVGDTWRVLQCRGLDPALAQVAAQARQAAAIDPSRVLNMKIDMTRGAPRLRGR